MGIVLDAAQRAAVERPAGDALLILGEAGHGKTTIAMHRLAHLWQSSPSPLRAAVVVPTDGLARTLQPMLRRLGVDLEVLTYDRWASTLARRAFRRLPREADLTPPSVMRMKRHPALRAALEEIAGRAPGRVDDDRDAIALRSGVRVTRGDLQHLFGDSRLLEEVARAGGLPSRTVLDTIDRTREQFRPTAEQEWAQVTDHARLVAVDHRPLDEGTASELAGTIDVEDYAVLFELDRLRAAKRADVSIAKLPRYEALVLDEAQEFAPIELALLGRTLGPSGTLIVAGDADQQTDETLSFGGWEHVMADLGRPDHRTVRFEIGYRCPPEVVALARAVLGAGPGSRAAPATPTSGHVPLSQFRDDVALGAWLARELTELARLDRGASVAVLCRSPRTAVRVTGALRGADVPARLVFDGRFLGRGSAQVTTVDEVKGLEFDFVVIPDAAASAYPDDPGARRAMYVAVTRARHQVALACVGEPSPVLSQRDPRSPRGAPGSGRGPAAFT